MYSHLLPSVSLSSSCFVAANKNSPSFVKGHCGRTSAGPFRDTFASCFLFIFYLGGGHLTDLHSLSESSTINLWVPRRCSLAELWLPHSSCPLQITPKSWPCPLVSFCHLFTDLMVNTLISLSHWLESPVCFRLQKRFSGSGSAWFGWEG